MGAAMAKVDTRIGSVRSDETLMGSGPEHTPTHTLSDLDTHILLLIAAGKQNADIAAAVGTGQAAVKEHIKSILRKAMTAGSRADRPRKIDLRPSEFPSEMASPFIA
jgi:DNA-binding NarL/FixJ family response regulator